MKRSPGTQTARHIDMTVRGDPTDQPVCGYLADQFYGATHAAKERSGGHDRLSARRGELLT
jgi:hypothetical protein